MMHLHAAVRKCAATVLKNVDVHVVCFRAKLNYENVFRLVICFLPWGYKSLARLTLSVRG